MRRGRPPGSGYDDFGNVLAVFRMMETGSSRRSAIVRACGIDQVRRLEMKMSAMGLDGKSRAGTRTVTYTTIGELARLARHARALGIACAYASAPDPIPDGG